MMENICFDGIITYKMSLRGLAKQSPVWKEIVSLALAMIKDEIAFTYSSSNNILQSMA